MGVEERGSQTLLAREAPRQPRWAKVYVVVMCFAVGWLAVELVRTLYKTDSLVDSLLQKGASVAVRFDNFEQRLSALEEEFRIYATEQHLSAPRRRDFPMYGRKHEKPYEEVKP